MTDGPACEDIYLGGGRSRFTKETSNGSWNFNMTCPPGSTVQSLVTFVKIKKKSNNKKRDIQPLSPGARAHCPGGSLPQQCARLPHRTHRDGQGRGTNNRRRPWPWWVWSMPWVPPAQWNTTDVQSHSTCQDKSLTCQDKRKQQQGLGPHFSHLRLRLASGNPDGVSVANYFLLNFAVTARIRKLLRNTDSETPRPSDSETS